MTSGPGSSGSRTGGGPAGYLSGSGSGGGSCGSLGVLTSLSRCVDGGPRCVAQDVDGLGIGSGSRVIEALFRAESAGRP
jgi:hypothetical protein